MFNLFPAIQPKAPEGVEYLSSADAKGLIDRGEAAMVVDVRSLEEWSMGRVPGAYHAPVNALAKHMKAFEPHRGKTVVLYCRTQQRSGFAAGLLAKAGFTDLKVINGGILQWSQNGYPLEK